eukprot:5343903-Prymnesium_polylepis.1
MHAANRRHHEPAAKWKSNAPTHATEHRPTGTHLRCAQRGSDAHTTAKPTTDNRCSSTRTTRATPRAQSRDRDRTTRITHPTRHCSQWRPATARTPLPSHTTAPP